MDTHDDEGYPVYSNSYLRSSADKDSFSEDDELLQRSPPWSPSNPSASSAGTGTSGFTSGLVNFIKSMVGSGILASPYAYRLAGTLMGTLSLVFVFVLAYVGIRLLIEARKVATSYPRFQFQEGRLGLLARAIVGHWGEIVVDTFLVITQIGFCCAYLIFIGSTLEELTSWSHFLFVALTLPVLIPLSWLRSISLLAPFSMISNASLLLGVGVGLIYAGEKINNDGSPPTALFSWSFPIAIGTFVYCVEGIGLVIPIEKSLRKKSHFSSILVGGLSIVWVFVFMFGLLSYLAYGSNTKSLVLDDLPDNWVSVMIKIALVVGLLFTYNVQLIPVIELTESRLFPLEPQEHTSIHFSSGKSTSNSHSSATHGYVAIESEYQTNSDGSMNGDANHQHTTSRDSKSRYDMHSQLISTRPGSRRRMWMQNLWRIGLVLVSAGVAIGIPHFGEFISVIGSLGGNMLAFVVPAVLHLHAKSQENLLTRFEKIVDWSMIILGLGMTGLCTALSVLNLVRTMLGDSDS